MKLGEGLCRGQSPLKLHFPTELPSFWMYMDIFEYIQTKKDINATQMDVRV